MIYLINQAVLVILSNNTDMSKLYGLSSTYSMSSSELNASLKLSALEVVIHQVVIVAI